MKLSLVISTSDASFDALAFKGDLEKGMKMAKEIGYDAVEIAVRDPSVVDTEKINELKRELGIDIAAIGTGQAYLVEGLSLVSDDVRKRLGAIERLKKHVDLSSEIGGFVIIGLIRGKVEGRMREKIINRFVEGVKEVAEYAKDKGVRLVVEPLNRYESDYINTIYEGMKILEMIDMDNVGLLPDTFHMNIEEKSIEFSINYADGKIFHFHVADSNRWAPGHGHLDFKSILKALKGTGYDGYISVECLPLPGGPEMAAKEAYKHLKGILDVI